MGDVTMTLSIHLYKQSLVVPHLVFFLWLSEAVQSCHYTHCDDTHRVAIVTGFICL